MRSPTVARVGGQVHRRRHDGCASRCVGGSWRRSPGQGRPVVGVTSDPDTLFPWKATQFQAFALLGLVYDSLVEFDQDLNVVPAIAESWDVSD